MTPDFKIDAEAVGALIVASNNPDLFLGVTHTSYKVISEKLPSQLSILTETKKDGETDEQALSRMLRVEELIVGGVSDRNSIGGIHLATSILETSQGNARLETYFFQTSTDAEIQIIDGEIDRVGWVLKQTVADAPQGVWWIRWPVAAALEDSKAWLNNPESYHPRYSIKHKFRVPWQVFELMDQGISEREALSRLGLHAPDQPLPYFFDRLISKQVLV